MIKTLKYSIVSYDRKIRLTRNDIRIDTRFLECDTCREKPGSPQLCDGFLHNRTAIERLREMVRPTLRDRLKAYFSLGY